MTYKLDSRSRGARLRAELRCGAAALLATALVAALGACASRVREPDFSAMMPDPPLGAPADNGAIYQDGRDVALFENAVAHRVGDPITIRLEEATAASKTATTSTKKASSAALPGPTLLGKPVTLHGNPILAASLGDTAQFDGSGSSAQSNTLTGDVTVTVARRLDNGNLFVRGEKWLTLNQGREYVRIQGIVRPIDIGPDNSISSTKVANASIAYGGKGALADATAPGWLSRFFNSPLLPF
jgi:flagellar L-ring protein FlgH